MVNKINFRYIIVLWIFVVVFIFHFNLNKDLYKRPKSTEGIIIDTIITKDSFIKGFIEVGKGNYISQNCPEVKSLNPGSNLIIGDIIPPFKILKKAESEILLVIKDSDSLYFGIVDYSKDNIKDPTFRQFFKELVKNTK